MDTMRQAVRDLAVLAFFALAAVLFTWPLAAHVGTRLDHAGDPMFSAWLLFRNTEALLHDPRSFWSAPMFHPHADTIAFSENYLVPTTLMLPARLLTDNPILLHNLALLLGFALSGWAAWRLARHVSGSPVASLAAGLAFAVGPFSMAHLGHFQMHQAYGMPLALLAQMLYFERRGNPGSGAASALGWGAVALVVQFLCSVYLFLFTASAIALVQAWHLVRHRAEAGRLARDLALFWAGAAFLLAPFAMPYVRVRATFGFARSIGDVASLNPDLLSCLGYPRGNLWFGKLFREWAQPECELAIGFAVTLFACLLWAMRRRGPDAADGATDRAARWVPVLWGLAVFAFAMSLGPRLSVAGHRIGPGPYVALYELVPGFDGLRAPGRFAALTSLAIGVLASVAIARLSGRVPRRWRPAVAATAVALVAVEYLNVPRMPAFVDARPPEYEALAAAQKEGVLLEWPIPETPAGATREAIHVFYQLRHGHPLVNGYSGFFPPDYGLAARYLRDLPSPASRRLLAGLNVAWLGVHTRDTNRLAACRAVWAPIYDGPRDAVFDVRAARTAPPPPPTVALLDRASWRVARTRPEARPGGADRMRDGRLDTRWNAGRGQQSGDGVEIELSAPAVVSEVRIRTGRRSSEHLIAPRVSVRLGGTWEEVKAGFDPLEFILSAQRSPRDPMQVIRFAAREIDALRLEAGAADPVAWSVAELDLACPMGAFMAPAPPPAARPPAGPPPAPGATNGPARPRSP